MTRGDRRAVPPAAWQGIRLRGAPKRLVVALGSVELLALGLAAAALLAAGSRTSDWTRLGVLFALSVVFEEFSRHVSKQRLLINTDPHPDMTSAWTFAAAVALPAGYAALLAVVIAAQVWFREQRATGKSLYRKVYSAATVVLACLASGAVLGQVGNHSASPSTYPAVYVVLALIVYTAVNRLLISVAVVFSGGSRTPAQVLGKWDDNALELATLCIAYMIAQVLLDQPWLSAVALVPMVLLQRGALVRQLEETATIDTKTQLLNALAWRQLAQRALARGGGDSHAAILVIDLDHFKAVNDVHGHLVGDAALFEVGRSVKQELRQADLVGRFGGEEFVVMLPDLDVDTAPVIAERLRSRIAAIQLAELAATHVDDSPCRHQLSASIGVAIFPHHAPDLAGLLEAADAALFVAKRAGRNRVEFADPGPGDLEPVPLAG